MMVISFFVFSWMIFNRCDVSSTIFYFIVVFLVVLEGGVAGQDAAVDPITILLVGTKAMLMSPQPACQLREDFKQLRREYVVHLLVVKSHLGL